MSKQRSLRKSKLSFADEEDEDGSDSGNVAIPPAVKAAQQKQVKEKAMKAVKSATLLSFDEGGEDADHQGGISTTAKAISKVKSKSKPSLRIPPGSSVTLPGASPAYNTQMAAAGEYTAERLKELQSATQRAPRSSTQNKSSLGTGTGAALLPPTSTTVIVAEDMEIEEEEEEDEGFAALGASNIPDQSAVRAAKAKREQLRSAPDYIDLGGAGGQRRGGQSKSLEHFAAGMKPRGTKKMQNDDLEEIMTVEGVKRGLLKATAAAAAVEDGEDVDIIEDEDEAWAEEQIRKGMRSAELGRADLNKSKNLEPRSGTVRTGKATGIGTAAGFLPPSQSAAIAATADEVLISLRAALQRAQLSQRQAEKNLSRTDRSLEDCISGIKRMEEELEHSEEKYIFIQKMRAYMVDICSMLAEKSPLVEELQDELQRAREERHAAYSRRCGEIESEEFKPAESAVTAAVKVLSSGGGKEEATAAANQAAEKEEAALMQGNHIHVELDEFGRDSNVLRRSKAAARIKAASRRQKQRQGTKQEKKEGMAIEDQYLGDITTSESEDEIETYTRRKEEVLEATEAVFRDADDEFSTLPAVKFQLEEWKRRYRGQYNDAYTAESVPALFAPFVRQELISWNPFDQTSTPPGDTATATAAPGAAGNGGGIAINLYQGFDQQEWHKLLFDFGMPTDGSGPHPNDPDIDLVPRLVRVLVLPIISALVTRCWRVLSTRQSRSVASMLAELMVYLDPENEALVGVVKATQSRLQEAVENLIVPSWPSAALEASIHGERYMERSFRRGLRLLRSVCTFHQVLPTGPLQNLAVQQLVVKHLLPYVRSAIVRPEVLAERAGRVLDALPTVWMHGGLVRGLEGVSEVVQAAVRVLEPAAGKEESRNLKRNAAKALVGVLQRLGDGNGAQRLRLLFDVAA